MAYVDAEQIESFVDDVASHTESFEEMLVVFGQLFMKLRGKSDTESKQV